jgi:hypothetical protein
VPLQDFWSAPSICLKIRQAGGQVLDVIPDAEPVRLAWTLWFSGRSVYDVGLLVALFELQLPRTPDLLPYAVEAWGGIEFAEAWMVTESRSFDSAIRQFSDHRAELASEVTETLRVALGVEADRVRAMGAVS